MILGVQFSPSGPLPLYEDAEGLRRQLQPENVGPVKEKRGWGRWKNRSERPVLGIAPTGHRIHGLELISFHKSGAGINVIFVDDDNLPYGWPFDIND